MKIKTRLEISAIFFICIVIAVGLTLNFMTRQVNEAYEKHSDIDEIVERAFLLNILTGDYLVHQEERVITQWLNVHDSLSNHLAGLELTNHEEQLLLDEIRYNHEETIEVFSQLVTIYEEQESSGEESALRDITITQLSVRLTDMVSEASLLSMASQERFLSTYQFSSLLVVVFVFVIAAGVGVNSYLIITTIGKPISDLHHGVEMIRSGNLDHKVGILANDEIGQLSRDFDEMSEELRVRSEKLKEYSENLEEMVEERTRKLEEAQEEVLQSERLAAIGRIASIVGHELRNPLTALRNSAHYIKLVSQNTDPRILKHTEFMEQEIIRSNTIISDLLDFARGPKPAIKTKTDTDTIINSSIQRVEIPEKIQVTRSGSESIPVTVDSDHLTRILINLIQNAVHAMPDGGELTIDTSEQSENVEITIQDTGTGISEENQDKIFTPLFSTKTKGTGLGLYIVKQLVESNGGSISFTSKEGEGTSFTISLPKEDAQ